MKSTKTRRESGRAYNKFYDPEHGFYNEQYWDDWNDHRDGFRYAGFDKTKISPKHLKTEHWGLKQSNTNSKLNKLNRRRKLMKNKRPR